MVGPVKIFIDFQRDFDSHGLSVVIDGNFHLPFLRSDFFRENLNGAAENGTGDNIEKRPDSKKLFERKKYGIQLQSDNFRTGGQTEADRWPRFFCR